VKKKAFPCQVCNLSYASKKSLDNHMSRHKAMERAKKEDELESLRKEVLRLKEEFQYKYDSEVTLMEKEIFLKDKEIALKDEQWKAALNTKEELWKSKLFSVEEQLESMTCLFYMTFAKLRCKKMVNGSDRL